MICVKHIVVHLCANYTLRALSFTSRTDAIFVKIHAICEVFNSTMDENAQMKTDPQAAIGNFL